ncbi:Holliday junction resolvase [Thalassoglobus neptunius]|uniref:Holliday junction resolvase n=1 Tax=Thalassoglobus neptunius TaxID=1938619 RepID=A0A5C5X7G6_9PLAN|nr:crossover junction endodeoxyribonuclease RuvC [Thalassoglobus neptunius]TWT58996.1 Holliday junction resolvase [Thalassoglobus neptunius]
MQIIGMDPSLSGFGLCGIEAETGKILRKGIVSEPNSGEDWPERLKRYDKIAERVHHWSESMRPKYVFLETYSFSSRNTRAHQAGEFGFAIRKMITRKLSASVVEVTPSELKQFATGKGNAKKDKMIAAASLYLGEEVTDDNQADAVMLAVLGRCAIGYDNTDDSFKLNIAAKVGRRNRILPCGPFWEDLVKRAG